MQTVDLHVVETSRLVLRPPRPSDAGLVSHYAGDLRVARLTSSIPHPYPPGAAEAFLTRAAARPKGDATWVIEGKSLSEVLGLISLAPTGEGRCLLGHWVAPAIWTTDMASEAIRALLDANPLGCGEVRASVFQDDVDAARALTSAGFDYIGDAEGYSVARAARAPIWTYARRIR